MSWAEWLSWASKTLVHKTKQQLLFIVIINALWKGRNNKRHGTSSRSVGVLCSHIASMVEEVSDQ